MTPLEVISVSVVHFDTAQGVFEDTLDGLAKAGAACLASGLSVRVHVIWNGRQCQPAAIVAARLAPCEYIEHGGHGNIGYGRGNNLALRSETSRHHLILNPDVTIEPMALQRAHDHLDAHAHCVCVTPNALDEAGDRTYLAKRPPKAVVLAIRGFAPMILRRFFGRALAAYEMRDQDYTRPFTVDIASGAFMYCRTAQLQAIGGFDPRYFLYFEDFDLSRRLACLGQLHYVPDVHIVHHGGTAARKGWTHIRYFLVSAARFFWQESPSATSATRPAQ